MLRNIFIFYGERQSDGTYTGWNLIDKNLYTEEAATEFVRKGLALYPTRKFLFARAETILNAQTPRLITAPFPRPEETALEASK